MKNFCFLTMILVVCLLPAAVLGQTATTTSISGLVADAQGAAVSGATVTLRDTATNQERTATTNEEGRYAFANLPAGVYDLTVSGSGFKQAKITNLRAEVTKPFVQDVALEVGAVTEQVTVNAAGEAQLLTQDATIGNTFERRRIDLLPNISRDATRLLALQPATTTTGEVAGARNDQNTFSLDGIDVSDSLIGGPFRTVVPTPNESIEEFRFTVSNPNASFGRSSGGQAAFVTRRGGNEFNGSAYIFHQNAALNANSWTNNRLGIARPPLVDNRFGGTFSGPVFKEKTFFFFLYEGRRNRTSTTVSRFVPTPTLKQGLLRFADAAGNIQTIDLRTANICGPQANQPCDPRGLGANPIVLAQLRLLPDPNTAGGDGLNTGVFTTNIPVPLDDNQGIIRLDHNFNDKWRFDGSFNIFNEEADLASQVDLVNRRAGASFPLRGRSLSLGLTGVLSSSLTNEFRFGFVHDGRALTVTNPSPQVPGASVALNLGGTLIDEPIDVDTQRSRSQIIPIDTYQFVDNLTWTKGDHTIQAGFNVRRISSFISTTDKVVDALTTPVAQITAGTFNPVAAANRPPTCSATITTNCIRAADVSIYNTLYGSILGQVSTTNVLITRNANLELNPFGTRHTTNSKLNAYEVYAADNWRVNSSLTLSYGLMYLFQTPPKEDQDKQILMTRLDTGEIVNPVEFLRQRFDAAAQGQFFNPTLAFVPLAQSGRKNVFSPDKTNFSPRVSVAWSPSFGNGLFGRVFGEKKTVVRGGYALLYDRINAVQSIFIPTLGVGFAQVLSVNGPRNAAGQPFRIGVDGPTIPLPVAGPVTVPIVPGSENGVVGANTPSETFSFVVDPFIKVPRSHSINFTFQRELPFNMVLEVGYIGRFGRKLNQNLDLNQSPYNFRDNISGQTFAQAFDAVAEQLRNGQAVTPQPWFENVLVRAPVPAGSRTAFLASVGQSNFINGDAGLIFFFMDRLNAFLGVPGAPNLAAQPFEAFNQALVLFYRTSNGRSSYNAGFLTLRKRLSNNLSFDLNYTLSRSLDQVGLNQNSVFFLSSSFDPDVDYGPSFSDRTHSFNSSFVYDLPFGKGEYFGGNANGFVNKLISGWYTSGIFRAYSGLPLTITASSNAFAGGIGGGLQGAILSSNLNTNINNGVFGSGATDVGGTGNPTRGGTGLNIFGDPAAVFNSVRRIRLSEDNRSFRGTFRGLPLWQFDLSVGKTTRITERVNFRFSADFINIFNRVNFNNPGTSLQNRANFGVISSQFVSDLQNIFPRRIQFGARFEF